MSAPAPVRRHLTPADHAENSAEIESFWQSLLGFAALVAFIFAIVCVFPWLAGGMP